MNWVKEHIRQSEKTNINGFEKFRKLNYGMDNKCKHITLYIANRPINF